MLSCPDLIRASILRRTGAWRVDCRVKPGNDNRIKRMCLCTRGCPRQVPVPYTDDLRRRSEPLHCQTWLAHAVTLIGAALNRARPICIALRFANHTHAVHLINRALLICAAPGFANLAGARGSAV